VYAILRFLEGPERGETLTLRRGASLTVGRSSQADRKVKDTHLSRVHLKFDWSEGDLVVVDLQSRNGVFVNGVRVDRRKVKEGDRVQAGEQLLDVTFVESLPREGSDDHEETQSFLDRVNHCEHCSRPITLATFADGAVKEKDNVYLCPDCSTILEVGSDRFQGFQVLDRLGAGSAGLVFRAKQLFLGRVVALKVLRRREDLTEKQVVRFLREAATISRLDHSNIVKIYDASEFERGYFIVMEYFPGRDLLSLVEERGPSSCAVGVSIALQLCQALAYASGQGIVHRDLKPANILYRADDGLAKLSDFGLAKRIGRSSWTGITREGEGLGTPCYMPPEQVRNARHVDARADIYALGASLYHILSGRYPVVARSYSEFIKHIMEKDPVPLRTCNPRVPPELAEVISNAMRKAPDERYQTAAEMGQALESVRKRYGYPEPPLPPDERI
jgi:serine/threonine-protein kinase